MYVLRVCVCVCVCVYWRACACVRRATVRIGIITVCRLWMDPLMQDKHKWDLGRMAVVFFSREEEI
jgi:hypothetical protein